jgi:hypothetical protein
MGRQRILHAEFYRRAPPAVAQLGPTPGGPTIDPNVECIADATLFPFAELLALNTELIDEVCFFIVGT